MTTRNIIGAILALIGATAAVWSPFRDWYDGRHGRDYRVADLFNGITGTQSDLVVSILLPLAFAALVTLVGLVLRSRMLVALSGLIVLGFTVLWMVRQGQEAGSLTVGGDGPNLGEGVAMAVGGGVLLLLAAVVMSGRGRREPRDTEPPNVPTPTGPAPDPWDDLPPHRP
jgi:Flp pilus assembly protein TadB